MIDQQAIEDVGQVTFTDNDGGHIALIEYCAATQFEGTDYDEPRRLLETIKLLNKFPDLVSGLASAGASVELTADALFEMARRPGRRRR